ncbi:MAG: hypothetical protein R3F46_01740 [bacterium]
MLDQLQSLGIDIRQEDIARHLLLTSMEAGNEEMLAEHCWSAMCLSVLAWLLRWAKQKLLAICMPLPEIPRGTDAAGYAARQVRAL